jgi:hypothetical protein
VDGVDFYDFDTIERGSKEETADAELPQIFLWRTEILSRTQ